ncbi:MAG: ArgE/DapE family deacylase [Sandaracinaceae bacterium]
MSEELDEGQLVSSVEPERIRERLVDLVRYPSFDGHEENVIQRIADYLSQIGAEVDVWHDDAASLATLPGYPGHEVSRATIPVVAARLRGSRPGPAVLLTGHVDVVPPGDLSQWSSDPFSGLVEGDRLYGRGSCDMKSGLVSALEVLEVFASSGRDFPGQIVFVAVPAEEDSGVGTLSAIERGWRGDVAFLPEPSMVSDELTVVSAHAGAMGVSIFVPGKSAHASMRLVGESAFEHYLTIHEELRRDERELNEREDDPLLKEIGLPYATSVGRIAGGTFISAVMDGLLVELRMGVAVSETVEEAELRIRAAVDRARDRNPWLRDNPPIVTVTSRGFGSARTKRTHPLVTELVKAHADVHGKTPRVRAAPFGCDMAGWVRRAGVPMVIYGPGDIEQAHAADEHVSLSACADVARTLSVATHRLLCSERIEEIGEGGAHVVPVGGRPEGAPTV